MQTEKDDIPMQRNACMDFIATKPDWKFECEYLEKGVSGYKKSAEERDVLQTAKSDAAKKKFDVLLVFMFDRLGRKEDETPFIVQWFDKQGIEIWSVNEGQQKFEGQADRLINYIRYWQSQGESEKTGIRVREKHTQMIKDGKRTGGTPPYGYKLISTNETNHKGFLIHKMVIDETESKVVRLIFDLAIKKGYGGYRIAKELNSRGIPSRKGGQWGLAVVNYMFRNPIYKGYIAYSKTQYKGDKGRRNPKDWLVSDIQNPEWVIISEEDWDKAAEIREARTPKKFRIENIDYDSKHYPNQTKSDLLLIGMIHCGECGSSMCTAKSMATWTTKDGKTKKSIKSVYKCNNKCSGNICNGRHFYKKEIIEKSVLKSVFSYLDMLKEKDVTSQYDANHINDTKEDRLEIKALEKEIKGLTEKQQILKGEVTKSILGESKFTPELLQSLITETEDSIENSNKKLAECNQTLQAKEIEYKKFNAFQKRIPQWKEEFLSADIESRKMMLSELIDDVLVKSNEIEIKFKIAVNNVARIWDGGNEQIIAGTTTAELS